MNRFEVASEKLSSARRHLISDGDRDGLMAALKDVEAGLEALGDTRLVSNTAASSVEILRSLVPTLERRSDANEMFDWGKFAGAVDELASWLYWAEPSAA
jgi:hypothetical protein